MKWKRGYEDQYPNVTQLQGYLQDMLQHIRTAVQPSLLLLRLKHNDVGNSLTFSIECRQIFIDPSNVEVSNRLELLAV